MSTKTVEFDIDIDYKDVKTFIEYSADKKELQSIKNLVEDKLSTDIEKNIKDQKVISVADGMKYKFLMDNFAKFSLDDLEQMFNEIYKP